MASDGLVPTTLDDIHTYIIYSKDEIFFVNPRQGNIFVGGLVD